MLFLLILAVAAIILLFVRYEKCAEALKISVSQNDELETEKELLTKATLDKDVIIQALQQKLELRNGIHASVVHDVKNSLTGIKNLSGGEIAPGESFSNLKRINEESSRMLQNIRKMLSNFREGEGINILPVEEIWPLELVNRVAKEFESKVKVFIPQNFNLKEKFSTNAILLETILRNLMHNAVKADENKDVSTNVEIIDCNLQIVISNNTPIPDSIRADYLKRPLELNQWALGGYLASLFAQKMGGEIDFTVNENGTEVKITLPAIKPSNFS